MEIYNSKQNNIWFTSDLHYMHKNITSGVTKWPHPETDCRQFPNEIEMSKHIVHQLNHYIKEDDILFNLGDWSFGGIDNIWNLRKQLRCQNIYLILGNHDTHILKNKELPNCSLNDYLPWSDHNFDPINEQRTARELFNTVQEYLEIKIDDIKLCLMHYPIENWNNRLEPSYHLYGHVHGKHTFDKESKRLDVGIDNAFKLLGEYKPFSWEEIKNLLL